MSGGVDSSVTAALLAERGFDVVGITLQLYDHGAAIGRKGACCAGQDIHDAARVAERLGIAHYVLDYESRFRAAVIEDFADSYRRGETPVPCIRCNQRIKFRDLLADRARSRRRGAGHRALCAPGARPERTRTAPRLATRRATRAISCFATTRAELDFLRFPLGGLAKDETRALARHFGLTVADKPDSQDICFVPQGSYAGLVDAAAARGRASRATSSTARAVSSAVIAASPISPSVSERGSASAAAEPLHVLRDRARSGAASSSGRARRWPKPGSRWAS